MDKNNKNGFTIIEVVLVLAIAGLIFLMVFIALPALQRSQRNTRRRQDMARILSSLNDYQANNNGKMPGNTQNNDPAGRAVERKELASFVNRYVVGQSNYANVDGSNIAQYGTEASLSNMKTDCGNSDQFCDPDGTSYHFIQRQAAPYSACNSGSSKDETNKQCQVAILSEDTHGIYYFRKAKCGVTEGYVMDGNGYADVAIMYVLEGGAIYCGDNQ